MKEPPELGAQGRCEDVQSRTRSVCLHRCSSKEIEDYLCQFYTIIRHHNVPSMWTGWVKDGHSSSPKKPSPDSVVTARLSAVLRNERILPCKRAPGALTHPHHGDYMDLPLRCFQNQLIPWFLECTTLLCQGWGEILAACQQWLFSSNLRICSICE